MRHSCNYSESKCHVNKNRGENVRQVTEIRAKEQEHFSLNACEVICPDWRKSWKKTIFVVLSLIAFQSSGKPDKVQASHKCGIIAITRQTVIKKLIKDSKELPPRNQSLL